ncbi:MAG: T9SS C-terminal target domain-containing protein [Crocinitomicaceae bacterium]|nr:T9SS C-terminal target domain-containing protein [Crocinitomicaceae bacterium]
MVNSAGSYSVRTSLGSSCSSESPLLNLVVETAPTVSISGPSKICWNGKAMFRASVAYGVWAPVDNTLLLASPQGLFRNSVKPITDNYKSGVSYTVTSKLGACTTKVTKNVYVRNVLAPSITISTLKSSIKVNESTTATATTNIAATGTWSSTNTLVSAIANPLNTKTATVKGLRVGSGANVVYFADDATTGCRNAGYLAYSVTAAASMVSVSTNSETATSNTSLYPNPSNGKFTIENTEGATTVKLLDLTGRLIATQPIFNGTATIDFSDVATGKYVLQIAGETMNEVHPIVIE